MSDPCSIPSPDSEEGLALARSRRRITRLMSSPHHELTASERDEKQDLIDKYTDHEEEQ